MRLQGSLDAFSLADIFQLLSFTKKTGALHLRRLTSSGDVHGVVFVAGGQVTGAVADRRRQALARRLVGAGLVGGPALAAAVDRAAVDPACGVVRALLDAGTVTADDLARLADEQVVDAVFDLLRWSVGDFTFLVDEPNPDDVGASRSVEDLVTEGRLRLSRWATLTAALPGPDTVLELAADPGDDPSLSRTEWALVALVDARRTVAEIADLTGRGDYAVVETLAGLVGRGLLVASEDGGPVTALQQRQAVLARLEQPPVPVAVEPPVAVQPPFAVEPPVVAGPLALVPPMSEPPGDPVAVPGAGERPRGVTPPRPERLLPARQPDFPDQRPAGAGTGTPLLDDEEAALSATALSLIDSDPAVTRSMLLRLIAGVQGL